MLSTALFGYLLPFCLVIGILVAVHEFGHFAAARLLRIRVTDFSIGFGPELAGRTDRKGCRWSLRLIPLGGYVKFWGDENAASAGYDPSADVGATDEERRGSFHLRPARDRALVLAAGPFANFVLGMVLLSGLYMTAGHHFTPPVVSSVMAGDPADKAGMRPGDRIVKVDGEEIDRFQKVQSIISNKPGQQVLVTIVRDGVANPINLTMRTESSVMKSPYGLEMKIGRIGIAAANETVERLPLGRAVTTGVEDVWYYTKMTLTAVGQMALGLRSTDELGGPIRIAQVSGAAFKIGIAQFVFIMSILSINLGIINLFPIPVLDGGHLVICAIEAILRRPPNRRMVEFAHRGGIAVIACLMVFTCWNDVNSLIKQFQGSGQVERPNTTK